MGFSIYTKTGDDGTSSLYSGQRRSKDDAVFHALGDVDELNSSVGVAREFIGDLDARIEAQLETIQSRLLDVGSAVATPAETTGMGSSAKKQRVEFDETAAARLEDWIDQMDEELPQLTTFILPSGGQASAFLHMARSICRRAERAVVPLIGQGSVHEDVGVFLNRLSDYLFTAARMAAKKANKDEVCYKKA